jgi:exopolyphosphatase / guanosine-5'-triphosphate,3'-diphosphate pyrophosphatase
MRVGVLDLGGNTFHLAIGDVDGRGQITSVHQERMPLRLGGLVWHGASIDEPDIRRAEEAVGRLCKALRRAEPDLSIAVATSALRDAANRRSLMRRLEAAAGLPIQVLTGLEEAALGFQALRASFLLDGLRVLGMDFGGGSLDVAVGSGAVPDWADTLPLGSARLGRRFLGSDPPTAAELRPLQRYVDRVLEPLVEQTRRAAPDRCVVTGGPAKAVARLIRAQAKSGTPLHGFTLSPRALARMVRVVSARSSSERLQLAGMKKRHVESVLPAAAVLHSLVGKLASRGFIVSTWGLREGLMLERSGWTDHLRGMADSPPRLEAGVHLVALTGGREKES